MTEELFYLLYFLNFDSISFSFKLFCISNTLPGITFHPFCLFSLWDGNPRKVWDFYRCMVPTQNGNQNSQRFPVFSCVIYVIKLQQFKLQMSLHQQQFFIIFLILNFSLSISKFSVFSLCFSKILKFPVFSLSGITFQKFSLWSGNPEISYLLVISILLLYPVKVANIF